LPPTWLPVLQSAKENRRKNRGSTTPELEQEAMRFVKFVADQVEHKLRRARRDSGANRASS
jgi:hypothetical protein